MIDLGDSHKLSEDKSKKRKPEEMSRPKREAKEEIKPSQDKAVEKRATKRFRSESPAESLPIGALKSSKTSRTDSPKASEKEKIPPPPPKAAKSNSSVIDSSG